MQKKVLLATGHEDLNRILRNNFRNHEKREHFRVLEHDVVHQRYLMEIVEETRPDIIVFHDQYLHSEYTEPQEREKEWIEQFENLRREYNDEIRPIFICEREKSDPFLGELVTANVLDIYRTREIDLAILIESLLTPPKYSKVAIYKENLLPKPRPSRSVDDLESDEEEKEDQEQDNELEEYEVDDGELGKDEEEKPSSGKIEEKGTLIKLPKLQLPKLKLPNREKNEKPPKIIEKKIINKQVIKREFKINITQSVEKLVGFSLTRQLILVGSPFRRCGSTFVSHMLAKQVADWGVGVSYVENPFQPSYSYDRFYGHRNTQEYTSLFQAFCGKEPDIQSIYSLYDVEMGEDPTHVWEHEGVRLIVKNPESERNYKEEEIDLYVFTKLILSLQKTPIVIIDVGNDWNKEVFQELASLADLIFLVVEPDIPNIQVYEGDHDGLMDYLRQLASQDKTYMIGNRFTEKIEKLMPLENMFMIPSFSQEDVFDLQYKGSMCFSSRILQKQVQKSFLPLVELFIPKDYLKKKRLEGRALGNLFSKKVRFHE